MSSWIVIVAGVSASLALLSGGTFFGWTSPAFALYKNENGTSYMILTETEESWIAALLSISGALGSALSVISTNKLGRKFTMLIWVIPACLSWLLIAHATEPWQLCLSRFISGISLASWFIATPMYLSEISPPEIRGILMTGAQMASKLGILFEYSYGPFLSVKHGAYVSLLFPLLFGLTFIWLPESPYYFIRHGNRIKAKKSLLKFRGNHSNVNDELEMIEKTVNTTISQSFGFKDLLIVKGNRTALKISLTLLIIQQFTGNQAIIAYAQGIFDSTNSPLAGKYSTIILGCLSVICTLICTILVDKNGRRLLLLIIFFYLNTIKLIPSYLNLLPTIGIMIYSILFAGLGALPYTIMGELFPTNVKALGCSVGIVVVSSSCAFVVLLHKTICQLFEQYGLFYMFTFYAVSSGVGAIYIYFCVPETKGKTLQQIQNELHAVKK
ncbi:facilitated trehalose transporter Tret1-like [Aphidius gifuensis]|uniref:facilitated trehalose transporter Tret1-like n=1 Tax=Aphidius gifuensis TaxID=684658 RepID=UPI001CDC1CFA|nr:facilitated trehalose transporter Tret1-like [Aphidius gifuensis]